MAELLQFVFSGLTVGAIYALVALGFTLIYKASDIINFAQGEFVMLGGMTTVFVAQAGVPLPLAAGIAIIATTAIGLALHRFAIEPARGATPVALIMITIGASIFLRGTAQIIFDRRFHSLPPLLGADPIQFGGAAILPQSLIVLASAAVIVVALWLFIERTIFGKAVIATAAIAMIPGAQEQVDGMRKPAIVADAAHAILVRDARTTTGRFFIDEEALAEAGVTDFAQYAVNPGTPLVPDLFL